MGDGTPLDRLHRIQAGDDAEQRDAHGVGRGCRSQGIGNVMGTQQVQLHRLHTLGAVQLEGWAATGIATDIGGKEIGRAISQGEAQHLTAGSTGLPDRESLVVQVEHGDPGAIEALQDFPLGLDNLLRPAKLTDVSGTGVIDDRYVGASHGHGVGNLADARSAQLYHCGCVFRGQFQQGQGRTQVIVQVAPSSVYRTTGAQDAGEHFLDRGLAAGAGYRSDRAAERGAIERTQLPQRQASVLD